MSGIDRRDLILSYHSALRKILRWYEKVGIHFFEMFLANAFYLYNRSKDLSSEKIDIKSFRHEIAVPLVGPQLPNPEHKDLVDFHYTAK